MYRRRHRRITRLNHSRVVEVGRAGGKNTTTTTTKRGFRGCQGDATPHTADVVWVLQPSPANGTRPHRIDRVADTVKGSQAATGPPTHLGFPAMRLRWPGQLLGRFGHRFLLVLLALFRQPLRVGHHVVLVDDDQPGGILAEQVGPQRLLAPIEFHHDGIDVAHVFLQPDRRVWKSMHRAHTTRSTSGGVQNAGRVNGGCGRMR